MKSFFTTQLLLKPLAFFKYLPLLLLLLLHVEGWGQTTVSYSFSAGGAVTGLNQVSPGISLDANIGFGSFKNSGTSNPAIYSGQLRLYQNATKGGSIKIYASNGVTITKVVVNASGTTGPAGYTVDGGSQTNLSAGNTYTMDGLNGTNELEFFQRDGSSSNRIYVSSFDVTYVASSCSAPSTQASDITFSGVTANSMNVNWTNGNGAGRVVIMNTSNSFTAPADASNPAANATYSGSGEQVIFNGTGSGPVSVSGLSSSTTYWFRVYEFCNPDRTYNTSTATNNPRDQATNAPAGDTDSDIIENTGFSYTSNINYSSFVNAGPLTSANSLELAQFTIRDGGAGNDADAFSTTLTNLTLSVSNHANLNRIAIFDGTTKKAEVAAGASVSFSSLGLVAADNSTKTFSVRASFNSNVTDNQQIQLTITSATAQAGASLFAAANAGGASSSTTGDRNRIEVTATQLNFVQQPTNTNINEAMSPAVTVEATDANNNRDLDYTSNINITSTGTLTGSPVVVAATVGLATFSTLTHTAAGTGLELSAASGALTGATSGSFDVVALQFINFDTDANWDLSAGSGYQTGYIYTENNWSFTGGPALRNGIAAQDGFPGAFGTYSWRLRNAAYSWTATYTSALVSGQKIKSVGFDVRRWDGSPNPNAVVEFSVNGGSSYTTATSFGSSGTINNAGLSNSSNWSTFSHIVNTPTGLAANQFILRVSSPGSGERIMIDNFSFEFETVPPTITLSSPSQVSADNVSIGASNVVLSHFQAAVTDADATLDALQFTTTGNYQAADLYGNFKLFYSSSSTFGSASSIGTVAVGNPGTFTFSGLSQLISENATAYFWIAADIDAAATNGRTIQVSANPTLTFADGTPTGTIAAGGAQTLTTAPVIPTVISDPVSNITQNAASSGGDVTSDGNATVSARGIVFGTSPNPTGNATTNGSGTGTFTSTASGLNPQTLYYLRAYATNSVGTAYGADKDFRTLSNPPTVQASSLSVANKTTNSIELSIGSVATFPGSGATEAGYVVLYNDGSAPTFSAANGEAPAAGTGNIFATSATSLPSTPSTSINVTGLDGGATYHFLVIPYTWDGSNAATYHYLTASAPTISETTNAGWSINAANARFKIDFDQTVAGVNNGQFAGTGFTGNPSSGQLNSNAWQTTGMSEGNGNFGGAKSAGDFARGNSNGGASSGGFYAFEVAPGNRAFGVQATGSDFKPGSITLRVQNNTGAAVTSAALAYLVYENNDEERSSSFNFSYSTDNSNYTALVDLDFTSTEAAAGSPAWKAFYRRSNIASLNIADGDFLYLRWSSNDVSGSGSRDELALDDIEVVFNPSDANPLIEGTIAGGIMQGNTTLSDDLTVAESLSILSGKVFTTNSHKIILQPSATLTENGNNTVRGTIEIETATTQNSNNTFGGLGIIINPKDNPMGTTKVTRITGERLQGGPSPAEENASLLRYFQVEPTTNTDLNATVEFFYADDELLDENDQPININDLALFKRDIGAANDEWLLLEGTIDGVNKKITTDNIQSFSEIALGDANNPLPIDLLFFNAIKKDNVVQLNWATAAEINNSHFEIEKSLDAQNFDLIGSVNGAGNSSKVLSYMYTDRQVCEICYYRLKQIDFDGKSSYSNIVMIQNDLRQKDYVNAYKANNHLVIKSFFAENHLNQSVNIDIYNRIGQLVYTEVVPGQEVNIIQPNLPLSGIYILRLDYGHQVIVKKIFW